ncbi:MAG: 3-dehydroquinate synthase [Anaerolineae bacterium]|nr:3-dehydroquinate synthase [Anaerolineae bacterium]
MAGLIPSIFIYGPPAVGKSTIGKYLAQALALTFTDLDEQIVAQSGSSIHEIFSSSGEKHFRELERAALQKSIQDQTGIVSLGAGALLDPMNRTIAEDHGRIVVLCASPQTLLDRVASEATLRPLLNSDISNNLPTLLKAREAHYASFPHQLNVENLSLPDTAWEIQKAAGLFNITGMGDSYQINITPNGLSQLGHLLRGKNFRGTIALISDENVANHYQESAISSLEAADFTVVPINFPAGEAYKNLDTSSKIWAGLTSANIERGSTIIALGGGVVCDLAGFAAATYLRGIPWVAVPTTLLAMVDASLGGKTGIDLPQGKNLVGAFYPPKMVLVDPKTLETLPPDEIKSGLAEVIKHGVIADKDLFEACTQGLATIQGYWPALIRQAIAVKAKTIVDDPYEKGVRESLNFGHTIGHAIEAATNYHLKHGEAIAIGMVIETRLAENIQLAPPGLADQIAATLRNLDLPTTIPDNLSVSDILQYMIVDKKKKSGDLHFALPEEIGKVRIGIVIDNLEEQLTRMLRS